MFLGTKYHAVPSVRMVFIGKDIEKCDEEELRDSAGTGLGQGKAISSLQKRQSSSLQAREN